MVSRADIEQQKRNQRLFFYTFENMLISKTRITKLTNHLTHLGLMLSIEQGVKYVQS